MTVISSLLYRSVASQTLSAKDLHVLLCQCRERNAREGLTGFLVLDQGRFLQRLEGFEDSLRRVWTSIAHDPRHREVELLQWTRGTHRLFADWQMQLGMGRDTDALGEAPPDALTLDASLHALAQDDAAQTLMQALSLRLRFSPLTELMRKSLAEDAQPWHVLANRLATERPPLAALNAALLGPLSRELGDAWLADRLTHGAVLLAMTRMQTMLRRIYGGAAVQAAGSRGTVLVASLPRELHMLGACFAATAFDQIGWQVQCVFPKQRQELIEAVKQQHVDVLQLALSDSLRCDDRLAEVAASVRAVRRSSRNPHMVVLLSGRAFNEQPGLSVVLGADGDGLDQGSTASDLQLQLQHVRTRRHSPEQMAVQAVLNNLALHIQRSRFGIEQEATQPDDHK